MTTLICKNKNASISKTSKVRELKFAVTTAIANDGAFKWTLKYRYFTDLDSINFRNIFKPIIVFTITRFAPLVDETRFNN